MNVTFVHNFELVRLFCSERSHLHRSVVESKSSGSASLQPAVGSADAAPLLTLRSARSCGPDGAVFPQGVPWGRSPADKPCGGWSRRTAALRTRSAAVLLSRPRPVSAGSAWTLPALSSFFPQGPVGRSLTSPAGLFSAARFVWWGWRWGADTAARAAAVKPHTRLHPPASLSGFGFESRRTDGTAAERSRTAAQRWWPAWRLSSTWLTASITSCATAWGWRDTIQWINEEPFQHQVISSIAWELLMSEHVFFSWFHKAHMKSHKQNGCQRDFCCALSMRYGYINTYCTNKPIFNHQL